MAAPSVPPHSFAPCRMGQACCRSQIVKVDTNDLYNHRTYSDSFKESQIVDKNEEYSAMEEDYTYDNMTQDEGTSTKVWSF